METTSLTSLVDQHLLVASGAPSGRSACTVYGGHEHALRQTLIALSAGRSLDEHESPGEATLQILHGRVELTGAATTTKGTTGDLLVIPDTRHRLDAIEDSAVLLTVSLSR
ncbi:MAG: LuxR family transcriptional regulator [Actinomycetes bacterium]